MTKSALQIARAAYQPKVPAALKGAVKAVDGEYTQSVADQEEIKKLFPNTYGMPIVTFEKSNEEKAMPVMNVGVILSGGQAPGGHNVIAGLFDGIKAHNADSRLYGFILGPGGLIDHKYMELTADIIDEYRNTGGFDMIGSGRTKLETKEQFDKGLQILKELDIKALVIIGGDDSNTNACVLAEYYKAIGAGVQVIGCPKTIDGDLKNAQIETSFGFDTACKVYSEVIGNIQRDCNSAQKYWHFIKLMGRSASHIALECALQTQPNVCIISEEVEEKNMSLDDIVTYVAGIVAKRAAEGNNFGTVLIPEGLIEFVPAMKRLIAELNDFLAKHDAEFKMIKKSEQRAYIIIIPFCFRFETLFDSPHQIFQFHAIQLFSWDRKLPSRPDQPFHSSYRKLHLHLISPGIVGGYPEHPFIIRYHLRSPLSDPFQLCLTRQLPENTFSVSHLRLLRFP